MTDSDSLIVNGWADDFARRFPPDMCTHGRSRRICSDCQAIMSAFNQHLVDIRNDLVDWKNGEYKVKLASGTEGPPFPEKGKMTFRGQELEIGDFVAFTTPTVPFPEVQAVVIDVENGVLEVMSTLIAPFHHSGKFTEDEVVRIMVVYSAEVAIPQESRDKNFRKGERVVVHAQRVDGEMTYVIGYVVAAFDSVIVARRTDGQLITGGSTHFTSLE